MFDQKYGFYPTPSNLGYELVAPYEKLLNLKEAVVLEPSAGKGDLAKQWEQLLHRKGYKKQNLHCIEIQPELQPYLAETYTLVGTDFLQFEPNVSYDLVFMNPPFNSVEDHLLKAWEVSRGGYIAAILPDSLMKTGSSAKRRLIRNIIEKYGTYQYYGSAFVDAERKTNVEVGIVRLTKPTQTHTYDHFINFEKEFNPEAENFDGFNYLTNKGRTEALVESYEKAKAAYVEWLKVTHKLCFYSDTFLSKETILSTALEGYKASTESKSNLLTGLNHFASKLQYGAWNWVFNKTKFSDYMTTGVKDQFDKDARKMGGMPFTLANIRNALSSLIANRDQIFHDCIVQVHELFRSYAPENTIHWEGWKTNSAYKVREKVIIPNLVRLGYWNDFQVNYDKQRTLEDIDRALCLLSGKKLSDINGSGYNHKDNTDLYSTINNRGIYLKENGGNYQDKFRSEFFEIRMYKKGTVHLTFLDQDLLNQFNLEAAKGKKWLPGKGGSNEGEREKKIPYRPIKKAAYSENEKRRLNTCKYVIKYGSITSEQKEGVFIEGYSYDSDERRREFKPGDWIIAEGYVKGAYKRYSNKNVYLLMYVRGVDGDYLITDQGSFYNSSVKKLVEEISK